MQKFLLHGVTGSGKTEIYAHIIQEALSLGYTSLLLVPEISLSVQLIARLKVMFSPYLALLHSRLSASERFLAYLSVLKGEKRIVVGTRSAVFAPLASSKLAVLIIDEEHDASFKEHSHPRYDARQVALRRAELHNALVILGSATPRLESYYYAAPPVLQLPQYKAPESRKQLSYSALPQRANQQPLPMVRRVQIRSSQDIISQATLDEIEINLKRNEQSILLLNRRGYFPQLYNRALGSFEKCNACSVTLNLHKDGRLRCHYCGYGRNYDPNADSSHDIELLGSGTQRLEDFLLDCFAHARIERLDSDAVSKSHVLEDTLNRFVNRDIDILIGTQMIARGLDIPYVSLVAVLQADHGLAMVDFRAAEKTFALLTQVAGRAGRSHLPGRVIFECMNTEDPVIATAAKQDYLAFYTMEIESRLMSFYPPFSRIVRLLCRSPDQVRLEDYMQKLTESLQSLLADQGFAIPREVQILGPSNAPIERMHHKYREHLLIKTTCLGRLRPVLRSFFNRDWGPGLDTPMQQHTGYSKLNLPHAPPLHHEDYLELDLDPIDLL